jgi:hypothetical protein
MTRKLNEKISNFEAKFVDLNEFIEKKDSLHAELKEAQDRLIKEQKEHTVIVNDLERKAVQEKERLRKEMLAKIKEAKNQFMKMTGNRLEVTTKRTIMENEQMNSELAFQSREAEKLLHKNEQLTLENKTMKRDLELYRQMEKELAKRNNAYLKTIRTLLSKLKALDATKKDILETGKRKEADILDLYQSQIANISMNLDESTIELDELRSKYSETSEKLKQITSMHDEVMRFMIQARAPVQGSALPTDLKTCLAAFVSYALHAQAWLFTLAQCSAWRTSRCNCPNHAQRPTDSSKSLCPSSRRRSPALGSAHRSRVQRGSMSLGRLSARRSSSISSPSCVRWRSRRRRRHDRRPTTARRRCLRYSPRGTHRIALHCTALWHTGVAGGWILHVGSGPHCARAREG